MRRLPSRWDFIPTARWCKVANMGMGLSYYVVDVFASQRYTGNPTAVVLDAERLDESAMRGTLVD